MKFRPKRMFTSLLILVLTFSFVIQTNAASVIEDGTYEISFDGMHLTEDKVSAAETMGSLTKPAKLEVSNGNISALITISGSTIKYENSAGEMVAAEIVKEDGAKKTYKFEVANLDQPIIVGTHVAEVGIDVEYRIVFKKDTLKVLATDESSSESTSTTNPKTNDQIFSTLSTLGIVMVFLLAATLFVNKRKVTRE